MHWTIERMMGNGGAVNLNVACTQHKQKTIEIPSIFFFFSSLFLVCNSLPFDQEQ